MKVKEVMSKELVVVSIESTVMDAAIKMREHDIGCIPIVNEEGDILRIITDRDIVLKMAELNFDPTKTLVKDIATRAIYFVEPDDEVEEALNQMRKSKVRRLPIIEHERLVGMISIGDIAVRTDLVNEVGETLKEISKPSKVENV